MFNLHSRISFVSAFGIMLWPGFSIAAANESSANTEEQMVFSGTDNLAGSLVWVIVALAIVIVLIILVIKWLAQRNQSWGANRSLRSLGGIALGQNNSLQVIEIAGRIYIVGVGENITLLDKIDDPEQISSVMDALERQPNNAWSQNAISQLLNKLRNREKQSESEPSNEQWPSSTSFENMLQSKLSKQADRKQQMEALLHDPKTNERLMDDEK